jgi:hypothetical protein
MLENILGLANLYSAVPLCHLCELPVEGDKGGAALRSHQMKGIPAKSIPFTIQSRAVAVRAGSSRVTRGSPAKLQRASPT